jgi:hypothetical protein
MEQGALLELPNAMLWPKLVICSAKPEVRDRNHALTVTHDLCATHNSFATLICCVLDDGLQRDNALKGREGFVEEFFYRTDLVCHAGQGCGGTLPLDCGGTISFSGIGIFRENISKGYQQCDTMQMHLVFAQLSKPQGSTIESSVIGHQVRKSIAIALKGAHQQKNQVVVLLGSIMSSQGEEVMEPTEFAKLLHDVLLSDIAQSDTNHFTCILVAVQSTQQQVVFEERFKKWLAKNDMPSEAKEAPQKS